jgi:Flp pilus assembly protein protease CpaA
MTDSFGLSLSAGIAVGLVTALAARWLDRHLDVLLDHGLVAAIGTPVVGDRPTSWNPLLEIGATFPMGVLPVVADSALQTAAGMALSAALILCAWIDWRHHILPDLVTLPLLAVGFLLAMSCQPFVDLGLAFCGAFLGWGMASLIRAVGRRLHGRMGVGDIKMLAAIGAWLGPVSVTIILLISSIFMAIYIIFFEKRHLNMSISFGPSLSIISIIFIIFIFIFPDAGFLPFPDAKANFSAPGTHRGVFKSGSEGTWVIYL